MGDAWIADKIQQNNALTSLLILDVSDDRCFGERGKLRPREFCNARLAQRIKSALISEPLTHKIFAAFVIILHHFIGTKET